MITRDDLLSFFDRLYGGSLTIMELEPNLWLVRTPDDAEVVVHYAPPVVILRVRVMELPASEPRRLNGRARDIAIGAEHAAITVFRLEQRVASRAIVEILAGVFGHGLGFTMPAQGAGDRREQLCHGD